MFGFDVPVAMSSLSKALLFRPANFVICRNEARGFGTVNAANLEELWLGSCRRKWRLGKAPRLRVVALCDSGASAGGESKADRGRIDIALRAFHFEGRVGELREMIRVPTSAFTLVKRNIRSNSATCICIALAAVLIVARLIGFRKRIQNQHGSVAELVKAGQLRSDRRGIFPAPRGRVTVHGSPTGASTPIPSSAVAIHFFVVTHTHQMLSSYSRLYLSLNPQPCTSRRGPISSHRSSLALLRFKEIPAHCRLITKTGIGLDSIRAVEDMDSSYAAVTATEVDRFAAVANEMADAAGEVIRKYFRKRVKVHDKDDLSPVTIADRDAELSMVSIVLENFPTHAIYGEENGWRCKQKSADFVWVLDPIDGTKSFITGKPVFGTLIALLYKGKPIIGIIDQPVLHERWIGLIGKRTTLNGQEVTTRSCSKLSEAYLYTTSPHLFSGDAELAFGRVKNKVKVPLYGCDCYAYALLASGFVDLVIESGLKPYDFLSLVPVIEGAGGIITDWNGNKLHWEPSSYSSITSFNVAAVGDPQLHKEILEALQWQ
ncbi:hypothetical protein HPP92_022533 [Vanilla planifolia]|uniref:histidinol-phosphatase n=2 Tax=Vanilla planifolia TaxID=51239 RepID=A0A835UFE5_VANPL|nr:hypothetical protein HPP92_022533 [Vanilla planifolia]